MRLRCAAKKGIIRRTIPLDSLNQTALTRETLRWHRHAVTRRVRLSRKRPSGLSERCIFGMLREFKVAMGRCVHCMGRRVSCICVPRQQDFPFLWTSNVGDSMLFASPGDVPVVIIAKYSRGRESKERHEKYRYSRISQFCSGSSPPFSLLIWGSNVCYSRLACPAFQPLFRVAF